MINVIESNSPDFKEIINKMLYDVVRFFIEIGRDVEYEDIYSIAFPETMEMNKDLANQHLKRIETYITDNFSHNLRPLDEYIIYNIIRFAEEIAEDASFSEPLVFFDKYKSLIEQIKTKKVQEKKEQEDTEESSEDWLEEGLEDILLLENMKNPMDLIGVVFNDLDFLDLDRYLTLYETQPELVTEFFAIDLDDYKDLIPEDKFEEYKKLKSQREPKEETSSEIQSDENFYILIGQFFKKLKFYIAHKHGSRIINNKSGVLDEKGVQALIEIMAKMFFHNYKTIDVSSEVDTGRGTVDFKFSHGSTLKVLVEVKLSTHSKVDKGYKFQLPTYLHAEECKKGVFVLICFTEEDFRKEESYLDDYDKSVYDIEFIKIDASGSLKTASKINNSSEMGLNH
ncbi:hypothetical protein ABEZ76_07705 [Priestia megaterium]